MYNNKNNQSTKVFFENMGENLAKSGNGLDWKDIVLFPVLIAKLINTGWDKYKEDRIKETKQEG